MPRDCVISYLPRSAKNKNKDGFDQGRELARTLSRITGIRCVSCFSRRLFVNEQKKLNSFERNLNMNSAFKLKVKRKNIENKTVILVDDIVTTGAGMAAGTRLLFSGGAYEVIGLCVGYTKKHKK
jgi:competence protein ComFC